MRTIENTQLTNNQKKVLEVISDYRNWMAPKCGEIKKLTGIKHNKSITEAVKSLQKRGLYPRNPFINWRNFKNYIYERLD